MKHSYSILLCLLFAIGISGLSNVKAQVDVNDSLALVRFYHLTNGPGWDAVYRTTWLTAKPVSTWKGVTVTNKRVTGLNLWFANLQGPIPSSIGDLEKLTYLNLSLNGLGGHIPFSMGNLVLLDTFDLEYSQLDGSVPSSIGRIVNLRYLNLASNQLSGPIPPSIGNLVNLVWLDLSSNKLISGSIPSSIGNLVSLRYLYLYWNRLTGNIPSSIGNLVNLKVLDLYNNQLSGAIPSSIGNLVQLNFLYLGANQLSGAIPSAVGNLLNLDLLYVANNLLTGSIPNSIGNLLNLHDFIASNNRLSGAIPSSIGKLANLVNLELDNNHLSDSIPSSIGNFAKAHIILLDYNRLSGEIPRTVRKLHDIVIFRLSHNQLTQFENLDLPVGEASHHGAEIDYNRFTFNGLEFVAKKYPGTYYAPQAIIPIHRSGNTLSVNAGGTLTNNTYNWYRAGSTEIVTVTGDSTFQPAANGTYYVTVTNSIATQLTLRSETIEFTMPALAQNKTASGSIQTITPFSVYPNPARTIVHVKTAGTALITVKNAAGKVMLSKNITNNSALNISSFAPGIYYVQNKTTGEVQKIVVLH